VISPRTVGIHVSRIIRSSARRAVRGCGHRPAPWAHPRLTPTLGRERYVVLQMFPRWVVRSFGLDHYRRTRRIPCLDR
jgi:hypothetical protein